MFPLQDYGSGAAPREHAADARSRAVAGATFGVFTPRGIAIRPEQMLRIMGYRAGAPIRPAVRRMAERIAELAAAAMTPVVHHCRIAIERCDAEGLVLADGTAFHGPVFAKHLADCREAIAFIMTLGSRFDSTQKNLSDSDNLLDAVFLETAGWVAIEEATRLFTQQARKAALVRRSRALASAGAGLRIPRRRSQGGLAARGADGVLRNIRRNQASGRVAGGSCAMMPKMSRTGFFGLRPCAERNHDA